MPRSPLPDGVAIQIVGLGDSLTEGVGDPRPGRAGFSGELDGWVTHVAESIRASGRSVEVRNYAVAGARLDDVIELQLPRALAEAADVMSCFVGINDLWDPNIDLAKFGDRFSGLFRTMSSHASIVLTASIHDVFAPLPVRTPLRQKLMRNIAAMNEVVYDAASTFDLVLVDLAARPETFNSAVRALDRLHPNRYGHQLIAADVLNELRLRGYMLDVDPPVAVPVRRGLPDLAHAAWVSGYVRQNWRRWRREMAASKLAATPDAASDPTPDGTPNATVAATPNATSET